jgi:serine/threonine protein kinase/Flp pilus assembly protein TadD
MSEEQRPPDDSPTGKRLGDFELLRELGRGGMGIVYESRQISLNRRVALKVLPPALGMTGQAKRRFEREARAAAKLHHTNIVPVHAIGEEDGHHFYSMDLIEGQSLDRVLRQLAHEGSNPLMEETVTLTAAEISSKQSTPRPGSDSLTSLSDTSASTREWFDTVAKLTAEVADALAYAHGRGVIHRDIKPPNLMLSRDGRLGSTDFGLARVAQEPGLTVSGSFLGTPTYMAPEQIAAGRIKVDHRADIYSLGAVLYELLTLQRPFKGESREQVLSAVMTKDPRPPRRFNKRIPVDLETICLRALEKDPDRRYQAAGELAQDLRQYLQRGLIAARRAGPLRRTTKWVRRHPVVSVVAAAAVALAILGVVAVQQGFGRTEANARRLVADAELHLREGTYREGLVRVNEALTLTPESLDATKAKARLLLELRHDRELANLAKEILASHPDDWEAHAWLASAGRYGGLADIPAAEHVEAVERLAPDTAEAWRLKGLMTYSKLAAVKCFDRALELDPAHYWALIGRAEAYIELKKFPEAVADAERAIVARPRSPRGRCLLANVYAFGFHDTERALAEYGKAIAIDPEDPITYHERSLVQRDLDRDDKFLEDTTRALELEERNPSSLRSVTLAERSWSLIYLGRYEEALTDARRAIEIEPERLASYWPQLRALGSLRRFDELKTAIQDLRKHAEAWRDGRSAAQAFLRISESYFILNELERAIGATSRAIEIDPEGATMLLGMRGWAWQEGGIAAGGQNCDLIARLEPKEPEPLRSRGWWLWWLCGRADAALADYERVIAMAPAWADAYSERGEILRRERRYREALADHDKAIKLAPKWATGFQLRALVHEDLEQWPEVLADLEQYFDLGGAGGDTRWGQAKAFAHLGRREEALAALDKAIEAAPEDGWRYLRRADVLFGLGRLDEALAAIDKSLEVEPTNGWAYLRRAQYVAHKPGSCAQAGDDLKKALEHNGFWIEFEEPMIRARLGFACPELAQPARSLEVARKYVNGWDPHFRFQWSFGAALYANGNYEEAKTALLEALDLKTKPDPRTLFFLAITESKLGRNDDARGTYDRAVARMNETWPRSPESLLLQEEAAELLGIQP